MQAAASVQRKTEAIAKATKPFSTPVCHYSGRLLRRRNKHHQKNLHSQAIDKEQIIHGGHTSLRREGDRLLIYIYYQKAPNELKIKV